MKLKPYISFNSHKVISVFLLLYFVLSPLSLSFTHEECNGTCMMEVSNCNMMIENMNDNCCDSIVMGNESNNCQKEFSSNNCMTIKDLSFANNFVITQNYQLEHSLVIVLTLDEYSKDFNLFSVDNSRIIINGSSPPIYLSVQSFLI